MSAEDPRVERVEHPAVRRRKRAHEGETADAPAGALVDALPYRLECAVGPHGRVALIDVMPRLVEAGGLGPEEAVTEAARCSYKSGIRVQDDETLLRYLHRHFHTTPSEMVVLKFCVTAPLFTARQWMRHRAGSFNDTSARYSDVGAGPFYKPAVVLAQSAANRQGSGAPVPDPVAADFLAGCDAVFMLGQQVYNRSIAAGVSRELARIVLPEARYTTFYWQVNLHNLTHFLWLRTDPHAQGDIRAYATAIHTILNGYCPYARRALDDYKLNAVVLSALEVEAIRTGRTPAAMTSRERGEWAVKRARLGLAAPEAAPGVAPAVASQAAPGAATGATPGHT